MNSCQPVRGGSIGFLLGVDMHTSIMFLYSFFFIFSLLKITKRHQNAINKVGRSFPVVNINIMIFVLQLNSTKGSPKKW